MAQSNRVYACWYFLYNSAVLFYKQPCSREGACLLPRFPGPAVGPESPKATVQKPQTMEAQMGEKILIVGSGGIGCELLKLLILDPANIITLVDDDTIDPTNLNRQFLFTREDVGQSKAAVAAAKMERITGTKIHPLFDRINKFKRIEWYRSFDVVYNCLDNNETRSFVNQRCYIAGVRMIDGGSAGWLGQSFHNGGECFDCLPPRTDTQAFPVCTIRQKPVIFEHCLVWAKMALEQEDFQMITEDLQADNPTVDDSGSETEKQMADSSTEEKHARKKLRRDRTGEAAEESAATESGIGEAKEGRRTVREQIESLLNKFRTTNTGHINDLLNSHTDDECASQPTTSVLIYELAAVKAAKYNIRPLPYLDSETFLGRIIPSICTTNAIIASLMVASRLSSKNYFLTQGFSHILRVDLTAQNPECLTCSIPNYICHYGTDVDSHRLLGEFSGSELITADRFVSLAESVRLADLQLDGEFAIALKNGFKYRLYFKSADDAETLVIKRLR